MRPGGQLQGPYAASVTRWSSAITESFAAYLAEIYQNDLASLGSDWTDQVLSQLQAAGGFVARLSWGIFLDGTNHPFDSVAVFDSDGNLLFDTVLIRTITAIEAQPDTPKVFLQATPPTLRPPIRRASAAASRSAILLAARL